MKKLLFLCLTVFLCLCCLTSCSLFTHKKNQWFSEEKLTKCLVSDMPQLDCDYVKESDEVIYANLTDDEKDDYLNELYGYLKDKKFEHLGTRGEIASSLSGAFTTYYLEPATELSEFKIYSDTYKFVYSDGKISTSSESEDFTFCILTVVKYADEQTLEYGMREFEYNFSVSLKFNSEAPLGGRYTPKKHEHTHQKYQDENGHGWSYTCGCETPPNFAQHFDSDGDQKCDDCGYDMVIRALLSDYAGWLSEIHADDVAEVKTTFEYVGVSPGNFKDICRTADKSVIADILYKYANISMESVTWEETCVDGGSAFTIEFMLTDGTVKKFNFNNVFYTYSADEYEIYFELNSVPTLEGYDGVTESYSFVTYDNIGKVYVGGSLLCEIPLNELEFVALPDVDFGVSSWELYYVETEFGGLSFFSDTVFYIYYTSYGVTDYYQLVGKNLDELIAEYSITEE